MPKRLRERELFSSRKFTIKEFDLVLDNGKQVTYEVLDKGNSVMMVPLIDEKTLLLVREYHAGIHAYEIGLSKGWIEEGQTPETAAQKELQEEIGYKAGDLQRIAVFSLSPGYSTHRTYVFLARDLQTSKLEGDEDQTLELVRYPFERFEKLIDEGDLTESRMIASLYLARRLLDKEKKEE